jgi:hypothetical protein
MLFEEPVPATPQADPSREHTTDRSRDDCNLSKHIDGSLQGSEQPGLSQTHSGQEPAEEPEPIQCEQQGDQTDNFMTPTKGEQPPTTINHAIVYNHNQVLCGGNIEELEFEDFHFVRRMKNHKHTSGGNRSGSKRKQAVECCICYSSLY